MRNVADAQPGDIVLQPNSLDIKSACTALYSLLSFKHPRYAHVGIYAGGGRMWTSQGGVTLQDAGAAGSIAVPYLWHDARDTLNFCASQQGKPYDAFAWVLCASEPLSFAVGIVHEATDNAYTCSSLVAAALMRNGPVPLPLRLRTVSPDDIGAFLGA